MNDEELAGQPDSAPESEHEPERRRSPWSWLLAAVVIILFAIVLFLLRQCGSPLPKGAEKEGNQRIEAVETMQPVPGTISVWIAETTNIDRVLLGAGISPRSVTDLTEGRFVVEVEPAQTEDAAERISQQRGVHDAGLVYEPVSQP